MNTRKNSFKALIVAGSLALATMTMGASYVFATTPSAAPQSQLDFAAHLDSQVRHEIATLPYYGVFDYLEFQVTGTEVRLTGAVVNPVTKSDAAGAVKHIAGVTRVVNDVTVLPLSNFDDRTRRAEYRSIFSAGPLTRYSMGVNPAIHIIVDNGHVTLEGVVRSEADRDLAAIRANSVPGVFSVTNNLRAE
ncbi:MAG: BON domain-containing protein [Candidatus Acidiferrales bacterium]